VSTATPSDPSAPAVPDWLRIRDGSLKPGVRPETTFVLVGTQPLYKLEVRPAAGKFTCAVSLTNNGRRLDDFRATYATPDAALAGGLEQLRNALGW
jgi:hypothetical protein